MIYLLDTNACIRYLNGRSPAIRQRLERAKPDEIRLCSIVKAELLYGAAKSQIFEATLSKLVRFFSTFESFSFDDQAAEHYGRVRAALEKSGAPIGPNDLLIASIALSHDATLVTANKREFARVQRLRWEDWDSAPTIRL